MSLATIKLIGYGVGALAVIALLAMVNGWRVERNHLRDWQTTVVAATRDASGVKKLPANEVAAEIRALGQAIADVKAKTAQAKADDAAHAKAVETNQNTISQESSDDYRKAIAAVRADYAERLRRATEAAAHSGRGGNPAVPGAPAGSSRPDAAAAQAQLPSPDQLTATEQAIQLKALQDWACKEGLAVAECPAKPAEQP